jgi:hypothetical protein
MTDEPIDAEFAEPEDPQLIARLRHRVQRSAILFYLVALVPPVLFIALTWNESSVQ